MKTINNRTDSLKQETKLVKEFKRDLEFLLYHYDAELSVEFQGDCETLVLRIGYGEEFDLGRFVRGNI